MEGFFELLSYQAAPKHICHAVMWLEFITPKIMQNPLEETTPASLPDSQLACDVIHF